MKTSLKYNLLQFLRRKQAEGGFTLIELLVVIIIIGILAAIALPSFLNQADRARETEAKNGLGGISRAQQAYLLENGAFASTLKVLDVDLGAKDGDTATGTVYEFKVLADAEDGAGDSFYAVAGAQPTENKVVKSFKGCISNQGQSQIKESPKGDGANPNEYADAAACTL